MHFPLIMFTSEYPQRIFLNAFKIKCHSNCELINVQNTIKNNYTSKSRQLLLFVYLFNLEYQYEKYVRKQCGKIPISTHSFTTLKLLLLLAFLVLMHLIYPENHQLFPQALIFSTKLSIKQKLSKERNNVY